MFYDGDDDKKKKEKEKEPKPLEEMAPGAKAGHYGEEETLGEPQAEDLNRSL